MSSKQSKAVFLDRDNTIIDDKVGYLNNPNKVKLLPSTAEAIKKLNICGFKVIVITNQSGIGRGILTEKTLTEIHRKMLNLLKNEGAKIDDIYYCPHHPKAKIKEYRLNCLCRKPLPGMIVEAVIKHRINLKKSFMIGDSERDIGAGKNAGCKTILINNKTNIKTEADKTVKTLKQAVNLIVKNKI